MTSLKMIQWRKWIPRIIWGLIGLTLAIFFIRVAVWEANYYAEKEGSERAVAVTNNEVDETVPTETEVAEYTVPAGYPRYLSIEKLGIKNSRVRQVTVDANNELGTPNNIFDVGWYIGSAKPGESGTILIDGHNGGPNVQGVFKNLPNLQKGDIITIERGDGKLFKYSVVENKEVPLDAADAYMSTALTSPELGKPSLTLITCTGTWSQAQQTYLSRQFVRAVLTE